MPHSPFFEDVRETVEGLGGLFNAHTHLDRANTLEDGYVDHGRVSVLKSSHISLQKKHALIQTVHDGPAYDSENLRRRVSETVELMIDAGTRRVDTMVDVTPDRVGTSALEAVQTYAKTVSEQIDVRAAAYTPLGFADAEPERWDVFEKGAKIADFIGALPEADDTDDYPGHIGFDEHCRRVLELAKTENKLLHCFPYQRLPFLGSHTC